MDEDGPQRDSKKGWRCQECKSRPKKKYGSGEKQKENTGKESTFREKIEDEEKITSPMFLSTVFKKRQQTPSSTSQRLNTHAHTQPCISLYIMSTSGKLLT